MRSKWMICGLIVLGLGAAISATLLMASFKTGPIAVLANYPPPQLEIIVAKQDLPFMTTVQIDFITTQSIAKDQAPEGYLTDSVHAIGRIISTPMVEGQIFKANLFFPPGAGPNLASDLPPGLRAVTISLHQSSALEGLLYPGCIVDVLAAFRLTASQSRGAGQAVSTTLLKNIQVLAVEGRTASYVAEEDGESRAAQAHSRGYTAGRGLLVTLMVNPQQAEAIQLATRFGEVSLTMRNPFDDLAVDDDATLLAGGQLALMANVLGALVPGDEQVEEDVGENLQSQPMAPSPLEPIAAGPVEKVAMPGATEPLIEEDSQWRIDIFRGTRMETRYFDFDEEKLEEAGL